MTKKINLTKVIVDNAAKYGQAKQGGKDFCSKQRHPTLKAAEKNMRNFMRRKGHSKKKEGNLRAYQCAHCDGYHWGHYIPNKTVKHKV